MILREDHQCRCYHLMTPHFDKWGTIVVNRAGATALYQTTGGSTSFRFIGRSEAASLIRYFRGQRLTM